MSEVCRGFSREMQGIDCAGKSELGSREPRRSQILPLKGDIAMQKRKLGNSGPEVAAVGFGCMGLNFHRGPAMDRSDATALLRKVAERGVTLFDTADCYGPFTTAEIVGEALRPVRDQVVIATKFGFKNGRPNDGLDSPPQRICQVADESLKRLGVGH